MNCLGDNSFLMSYLSTTMQLDIQNYSPCQLKEMRNPVSPHEKMMKDYIHTVAPMVAIDMSKISVQQIYDYLSSGRKIIQPKKERRGGKQLVIDGKLVPNSPPWNQHYKLKQEMQNGTITPDKSLILFQMECHLMNNDVKQQVSREISDSITIQETNNKLDHLFSMLQK